jgi:hypothetical protein
MRLRRCSLLGALCALGTPFIAGGCDTGLDKLLGDSSESSDDGESAEDGDDDGESKKKKKKKKKNEKQSKKDDGDEVGPGGKLADGSYAKPAPGDVPALKVGAWAKYHMGQSAGDLTYGVVEKRKERQFLIDFNITNRMSIAGQVWMDVPDLRDRDEIKLLEAAAKVGGGAVQKLSLSSSSPLAGTFEKLVSGTVPPKFEGLPQEDVKVKAGHFRGCYRWRSESVVLGQKSDQTIWTHPAVPMPAFVKIESADGGTFELIEFGLEGAKRSF